MGNTCPLRITATAGTKLVGAFFLPSVKITEYVRYKNSQIKLSSIFVGLRPEDLLIIIPHEMSWIKLAPIVQYSSLLPSLEVWPVSQCHCGGPPLSSARHYKLGELLPNTNYLIPLDFIP